MNYKLLIAVGFFVLGLTLTAYQTASTVAYLDANTVQFLNNHNTNGKVLGASTNGLVGYWNFDEGSGIIAHDISGNGNNGTITGAAWTVGKVGSGALQFDGNNNVVTVPSSNSLNTATPFSITV